MKFIRTKIPDVVICQPQIHGDHRGYFCETFRQDKLSSFIGKKIDFVQDNESKSSYGVLRGLHFQLPPFEQSKLVRAIEGSVLDVVVDLRQNSETFGQHVSIELSSENKTMLFVPRGFAHGFVVLSDSAIFSYKVDNYYTPAAEMGIRFDDSSLDIDWCVEPSMINVSDKDRNSMLLSDIVEKIGVLGRYDD
jgi:dTDP-4-dehydrorhamnose 3,5-epimerase